MFKIPQDERLAAEIGRRRMFMLISVFILLAFGHGLIDESDILSHSFDEYVLVAVSLIAIAYMIVTWKTETIESLQMQANIITGLLILALLAQIYAFPAEMADAADIGNEIPGMLLLAMTLINRFV